MLTVTASVSAPNLGLVFLHRASARLALVEAGVIDLHDAIDGLVEPFEELVGRPIFCRCARDIIERWERNYPPVKRKRRRKAA